MRPKRADISFVHGLVADSDGRVLFQPPSCEGFWGSVGAKQGVIATV